MSAVRDWLEAIGLRQYADAFEANDIDTDLLRRLDDQLLKDIGVSSAGHRLRLRDAIAKLVPTTVAEPRAESSVAATDASATAAERRQLTVMFCDLVGSTATSAWLDPEDLRAVIGAYHRSVADTVTRFAGFVAKYMGDGVLKSILVIPRRARTMPSEGFVQGSPLSTRSAGFRLRRR
jgi:class 3 adenylate cyclase